MAAYGGDLAHHEKDLVQVKGHSGVHTYSPEETAAFAEHFNIHLSGDPDLAHLFPIKPQSDDLLGKVKDGLLLAKFINIAVKDTIDTRALNRKITGKELSLFQINENQTLVISSAKAIGVKVTNIGASELINGRENPTIVLGLIWQLVRSHLLNNINLKNHPELVRLLEKNEELSDLLKLPPETLLLRWFNYHLTNAGHTKINNFSSDVKDSEAYTILLNQINPQVCDKHALQVADPISRANIVLENAKKLEVKASIKGPDIVSGNPRLNLLFTAAIFNQCPGLDPLSQEEIEKAGLLDDDIGDSREERAFRMWINSLPFKDADVHINNLFEDATDGIVLLRVLDEIQPGIVNWKSVEKNPSNKFKKVSNCNYVVVLGKQLKFSLVNISGADINGGNKKLILALVWQMMRLHTLNFLKQINAKKFGTTDNKEMTDEQIINWANNKATENKTNNSHIKINSFKDSALSSSLFFFDLLSAIEPRIIDWALIKQGSEISQEDKILNAKYAISVARKMGAVIFLLSDDIVEVKPKMIMTFVASIMALEGQPTLARKSSTTTSSTTATQ